MKLADRTEFLSDNVRRRRAGRPQQSVALSMQAYGHEVWTQALLSRVERGERALSAIEAVDLADVLGCELTDLVPSRRAGRLPRRDPAVVRAEVELLAMKRSLHTVIDREIARRLAVLAEQES